MRRLQTALTDGCIMTPIESPNLPKRGIALAAVSVGAEKAKEYLESRGIAVFDILPSSAITDGTAAHADLHLLHLGGRKIILSREQLENAQKLASSGFDVHILDSALGAEYPADVPLNAAVFGNYAILNPKTVCPNINFFGRTLIPVRQGYAKCSAVPVTENAIITDDVAIASAAEKSGLEVLLVSKGDVLLPGREYGFIGGCCGLIAPDIMLFNGDLSSHGDADRIRAFLSSFGVSAEETGHFPLTDIGGILPLAEK